MRKIIAVFLLATPCLASGPKYVGPTTDSNVKQELDNVYQDIRNPVINFATISSATVTSLTVSTMTVSSFTATSANIKGIAPTITATAGTVNITDSLSAIIGKLINFRIVQAAECTTTTAFSTTSSSFQNTNLTCSITPIAASDKIFVIASGRIELAANNHVAYITISRGGSNLGGTLGLNQLSIAIAAGAMNAGITVQKLDSPASASSVTYTVQIKNDDNATTVDYVTANQPAVIDLFDIAIGD